MNTVHIGNVVMLLCPEINVIMSRNKSYTCTCNYIYTHWRIESDIYIVGQCQMQTKNRVTVSVLFPCLPNTLTLYFYYNLQVGDINKNEAHDLCK